MLFLSFVSLHKVLINIPPKNFLLSTNSKKISVDSYLSLTSADHALYLDLGGLNGFALHLRGVSSSRRYDGTDDGECCIY